MFYVRNLRSGMNFKCLISLPKSDCEQEDPIEIPDPATLTNTKQTQNRTTNTVE